jgi:hypothetical protein
MGVFDQAARFAARADPEPVLLRLLGGKGVALRFRDWLDTRSFPLPGGPDRMADLVAGLDDPAAADKPSLLVLEFQAQEDVDKLDVTLEEVAILRSRARHGEDRKGKYRVLAGLVYLQGRCPEDVLDMTLPDGSGTRHAALVWNVVGDDAAQALEAVAGGRMPWGMLLWVALMAGGGEEVVSVRWKEVVTALVSDSRMRSNLAGIAMVFADLAGRVQDWKRGLEGWEMTESQVVNEWTSQAEARGELKRSRKNLLELLEGRFPGLIPAEVVKLINEQESQELLDDWFRAGVRAFTFEQFLAVLKR